jgi:hypothetical protein
MLGDQNPSENNLPASLMRMSLLYHPPKDLFIGISLDKKHSSLKPPKSQLSGLTIARCVEFC